MKLIKIFLITSLFLTLFSLPIISTAGAFKVTFKLSTLWSGYSGPGVYSFNASAIQSQGHALGVASRTPDINKATSPANITITTSCGTVGGSLCYQAFHFAVFKDANQVANGAFKIYQRPQATTKWQCEPGPSNHVISSCKVTGQTAEIAELEITLSPSS